METSETLIKQDQDLVAALQRGEEAAVPRLVRRYGGLLYSVALRVTGNSADAEEAVQDALLQAFRLASRFRGESAFQTWLVRIAINAAKMRRRSQARHGDREVPEVEDYFTPEGAHRQPVPAWTEVPEDAVLSQEQRERVHEAIEELPEEYKLVVLLIDIEGMKVREAAESLEISLAAAKSRLHRARLKLRDALAPYFQA